MGYREWLEEVTGFEEYEMPYGTNSFVKPHVGNVRETTRTATFARGLPPLHCCLGLRLSLKPFHKLMPR